MSRHQNGIPSRQRGDWRCRFSGKVRRGIGPGQRCCKIFVIMPLFDSTNASVLQVLKDTIEKCKTTDTSCDGVAKMFFCIHDGLHMWAHFICLIHAYRNYTNQIWSINDSISLYIAIAGLRFFVVRLGHILCRSDHTLHNFKYVSTRLLVLNRHFASLQKYPNLRTTQIQCIERSIPFYPKLVTY